MIPLRKRILGTPTPAMTFVKWQSDHALSGNSVADPKPDPSWAMPLRTTM
jgi:hypothetical protein